MTLRPCASCGRHVREIERACPFCRASIDPTPTPPSGRAARPIGRLGRAAIFAFGAAATTAGATSIEGCAATDAPADAVVGADAAAEIDTGGPAPLYGGAPDAATTDTATTDTGNVAPPYGAASEDAGSDAGLVAMYGSPPADAGHDAADPVAPAYGGPPDPPDAGGVAALYGGSPG